MDQITHKNMSGDWECVASNGIQPEARKTITNIYSPIYKKSIKLNDVIIVSIIRRENKIVNDRLLLTTSLMIKREIHYLL